MTDYSKWTLQSIFNKVAKHLLNQNKKAKCKNGCVCYDKKENRCAFGCLLPLEYYRKNGDQSISQIFSILLIEYNSKQSNLLHYLQHCHDSYHPNQWKNQLKKIAVNYNLKVNF